MLYKNSSHILCILFTSMLALSAQSSDRVEEEVQLLSLSPSAVGRGDQYLVKEPMSGDDRLAVRQAYSIYLGNLESHIEEKEKIISLSQKIREIYQEAISRGYVYVPLWITYDILHQCGFSAEKLMSPSHTTIEKDLLTQVVEKSVLPEMAHTLLSKRKIALAQTQVNLADWLSVSQPTISNFLNRKPSPKVFQKLKEKMVEEYWEILNPTSRGSGEISVTTKKNQ